mmetsp:Transcript_87882/g.273148  ORF Transcript_87882/g.273148 Transcript_87882/m.273148 type:complete len:318 (-) Transcript_87882:58-1011(-)
MVRRRLAALAVALAAAADCCGRGGVPFAGQCVPRPEALALAKAFLLDNMPPIDIANGLSRLDSACCHNSLVNSTLMAALDAKCHYKYAAAVPKDTWLNYVLPYASLNEPRVDWPTRFSSLFAPLVPADASLEEAVIALNGANAIWSPPAGPISFQADRTPRIMDPFSVMAFGYSSCTGFSIYLVDALRAIGVPARVVGTPAWHGLPEKGNHNWVEVWTGAQCVDIHRCSEGWAFLEGQQTQSCKYRPSGWSPGCWFCNAAQFGNATKVYAAAWDRGLDRIPLAWAPDYREVPGVDRSAWYRQVCAPDVLARSGQATV